MTSTAELTDYLDYRFGAGYARPSAPRRVPWPAGPSLPRAASAYAAVLRDDVAAGTIQLGTVLAGPQGGVLASAVKAMSPPLARPFEQLLIEALIEVAAEQTDRRRQGAMLVVAGAAAAAIAATLLANR